MFEKILVSNHAAKLHFYISSFIYFVTKRRKFDPSVFIYCLLIYYHHHHQIFDLFVNCLFQVYYYKLSSEYSFSYVTKLLSSPYIYILILNYCVTVWTLKKLKEWMPSG